MRINLLIARLQVTHTSHFMIGWFCWVISLIWLLVSLLGENACKWNCFFLFIVFWLDGGLCLSIIASLGDMGVDYSSHLAPFLFVLLDKQYFDHCFVDIPNNMLFPHFNLLKMHCFVLYFKFSSLVLQLNSFFWFFLVFNATPFKIVKKRKVPSFISQNVFIWQAQFFFGGKSLNAFSLITR